MATNKYISNIVAEPQQTSDCESDIEEEYKLWQMGTFLPSSQERRSAMSLPPNKRYCIFRILRDFSSVEDFMQQHDIDGYAGKNYHNLINTYCVSDCRTSSSDSHISASEDESAYHPTPAKLAKTTTRTSARKIRRK